MIQIFFSCLFFMVNVLCGKTLSLHGFVLFYKYQGLLLFFLRIYQTPLGNLFLCIIFRKGRKKERILPPWICLVLLVLATVVVFFADIPDTTRENLVLYIIFGKGEGDKTPPQSGCGEIRFWCSQRIHEIHCLLPVRRIP